MIQAAVRISLRTWHPEGKTALKEICQHGASGGGHPHAADDSN